jgi:Mn-dependent DtxR family transcriptional regulator
MDEMAQVMQEFEQRLEIALDNIETAARWEHSVTQDDIDVIRAACGKPRNSQVNPILRDVINDFGKIFGGNHASI